MNEMIEKVAKGIFEFDMGAHADKFMSGMVPGEWDYWLGKARAAIEAIEKMGFVIVPREPTEAMVVRGLGWREFDIPDHWPDEMRVPYGSYRAMIDTALAKD